MQSDFAREKLNSSLGDHLPTNGRSFDITRVRCHNFGEPEGDYILELMPEATQAYMTGRRRGVRQGDFIRISRKGQTLFYQILTIEHYASPRHTWMALLVQTNPSSNS